MSLVNVSNLSFTYGGDFLFKDVTFSIEKDSKIGLVGRNGTGKSTLFQLLAKHFSPTNGTIHIARDCKIEYLTQDPNLNPDLTLYETVYQARPELISISQKINELENKLNKSYSDITFNELSNLQDRFTSMNGYLYEAEVNTFLYHLKFPKEVWNQKAKSFSGGEQTRIQLASILLREFDILLLDEPTNHLDFSMIFWLEKYLANLGKPFIVISHDRYFLDKAVKQILDIENTGIEKYNCNYSNYINEKKLRIESQEEHFKRQQKFIEKTEDFIRRNMAGQKVKQAKSRLKMLDKMDIIKAPGTNTELNFKVESSKRSGNDVLVIKDLEFGFSDKCLARKVNLLMKFQNRIALLGPNGCGKTTFLKIINNEVEAKSGYVKIGASINIGYYDQLHLNLNPDYTVLETIWDLMPGEAIGKPLSYLARFGFRGDILESKISTLSGGEKARLYLSKLLYQKPNFLILDEPTNHLDISMINSLEKALENYDGTILFVSHDRYFIEKIANKYWLFVNETVKEVDSSLEEIFIEKKKPKETPEKKVERRINKAKRVNEFKLNKILEEVELLQSQNYEFEDQVATFHADLSDSSIYSNTDRVKEIHKNIENLKEQITLNQNKIDELENQYLEMSCV